MKTRLRVKLSSTFVRGVGVLSSGAMLGHAISLVTLPIISRLYEPVAFGELALIVSIASVLTSVALLGLPHAVVRADTDESAVRTMIVGAILGIGLVFVALLIAVVLMLLGVELRTTLHGALFCGLVGLMSILTSMSSYLRYYANRREANSVLFTNSIIGSLATLLITVPLGFAGMGTIGLVAGSVGSLLVANAQMYLRLKIRFPKITGVEFQNTLKSNRAFMLYQYPANLLETISTQTPRQAISAFFGTVSLGWYSMTERVLAIPMRLVGAPISTLYFREASSRTRQGRAIGAFTNQLVVVLLAGSLAPVIVLLVWGEQIFRWALGAEWAPAGVLASIVVVQYVFLLARTSVGTARIVVDRQGVNLIMSATRALIEIGALVVGAILTGGIFGAIAWFAIGSTAFLILDMTTTMRLLGADHWRFVLVSVSYCVIVCLVWLMTIYN
ncbi:hypothetical protein GCM10009670_25930 [Citricoccus alkalitolerans]